MKTHLRESLAPVIVISMVAGCADTRDEHLSDQESQVIGGATNVALTGTASASSAYTGYPATNANDGDAATLWQSANAGQVCPPRSEDCLRGEFLTPTWLKVTFDSAKTLDEISIRFSTAPRAYDLQYCPASVTCMDDGSGWIVPPGGTFTSSPSYARVLIDAAPQATAVRVVYSVASASGQRAQAYELEAWTYPEAWNTGAYDCNAVCNASTVWSTECRQQDTFAKTNCGEYGIYSGSCSSWCNGPFMRTCSSSCTAPDGTTSTCGTSGYACVVDSMQQTTPLCKDVCTYQASAHYTYCKMTSGSNIVTNCQEYGTYHPAQTIKGAVSLTGGSDVNRCANGIVPQVNSLPSSDRIGAISYDENALGFSPWCDGHWQGIQRLTNDPTQFVMSASNVGAGNSGRLARGTIPDGGVMARTGSFQPVVDGLRATATDHPGGMQALGDWVFVGLENAGGYSLPAYIQQWSIGPSGFTQIGGSYNLGPNGAAAVAMTKLAPMAGEPGSRFLMMVPRYGDSSVLEFYLTPPGVSLAAGLSSFYLAGSTNMKPNGIYANGWMGFQNVNFVTDCNGDVYLFGMANTDSDCYINTGDDWLKAYRVFYQFDPVLESLAVTQLAAPSAEKHVYLSGNSNLAAAAGLYVTPENKLVLMATEHTESSSFGSGIDISEVSAP